MTKVGEQLLKYSLIYVVVFMFLLVLTVSCTQLSEKDIVGFAATFSTSCSNPNKFSVTTTTGCTQNSVTGAWFCPPSAYVQKCMKDNGANVLNYCMNGFCGNRVLDMDFEQVNAQNKPVDASGVGHAIGCTNCPVRVAGRKMQSAKFTGVESIDVPALGKHVPPQFTILLWVKPSSTLGAGKGTILTNANGQQGFTLAVNGPTAASGASTFSFTAGTTVTGNALTFGQWNHIAAAVDLIAGTVTLYNQGVVAGSGSISTSTDRSLPWSIGKDSAGAFIGDLDEVQIIPRLLLPTAIQQVAQCGNGDVNPAEECDGVNLAGATCTSIGFIGGALSCKNSCKRDTSLCSMTCGNGVVDGNEQCEGTNLAGASCTSLGFVSGTLSCTDHCTRDVRNCFGVDLSSKADPIQDPDPKYINNPFILLCPTGKVACGFLGSALNPSYAYLGLSQCCDALGFYVGSQKSNSLSVSTTYPNVYCSGNDVVCGSDGLLYLGSMTCCPSSGILVGQKRLVQQTAPLQAVFCNQNEVLCGGKSSSINTFLWDGIYCCGITKTTPTAICGNGIVEAGEQCDGTVGTAACDNIGMGFTGGSLRCKSDCTRDTSGCHTLQPIPATCHNGVIDLDKGEECDTVAFGGANCINIGYGFTGGTLRCGFDCTRDTSLCSTICGNGILNIGEQCDGGELAGTTCTSLGYGGGTLSCGIDCKLDETRCTANLCGNGALDAGEVCDRLNFGGKTCRDFGYTSGDLECYHCSVIETVGCS